jgi:uncharacterized UBP type Zn finger protein
MNAPPTCRHLAAAVAGVVPSSRRCEACVTAGTAWVHLRMCLTCGEVGCCDASAAAHARAHAERTGHPLVRSVEPGESWRWCFVDGRFV